MLSFFQLLRGTLVVWATAFIVIRFACSAHGAFIIDIQDQTIQAGSTSSLNIWIRSTGTDNLALSSFLLEISTINQVGGELRFVETAFQAPDEQGDPLYVFANDSDALNYGAIRQNPNLLRIVVSDFTASLGDVAIGTTNRLLGTVNIQHITPSPETSSGEFRVSLVQDPTNTFFLDSSFDVSNPAPIDLLSFDMTDDPLFGSGKITVFSPTAVPEPSSILFVSIFAVGGCSWRMRRRSMKTVRGK